MTTSLGDWLKIARHHLNSSAFDDDIDLTLYLLSEHHLKKNRAWLLANQDIFLSVEQIDLLNQDLHKIAAGYPLPYLLGEWEFFGIPLSVNPDVLIPRPETELLVDAAIRWLTNRARQQPPNILDIGTGSGAIAIAIARHVQKTQVFASDISFRALRLCHTNLHKLDMVNRVQLIASDGYPPLQAKFDLICANLPYIASEELKRLAVSKHEPGLALDGGEDGLTTIHKVFSQVINYLADTHLLLFEIEASQGELASAMAKKAFPCSKIEIIKDLAGNDRILSIENL
jgi:release factor glutamine methyltransferase